MDNITQVLLNALERAKAYRESIDRDYWTDGAHDDYNQICAAIAKAKGEE